MKRAAASRMQRRETPPPATRRWPLAALAVVLTAVACWHMLRFTVVVDDAFIALRTAMHWAGHGSPEYNPGSGEWVPTSFLWVALLAGLSKLLPFVSLPRLAQVLGGASGMGAIVLLATGFPRQRVAGAFAALLCAGSAVWAAWPLSGMETSLFALGVLVSVRAIAEYLDTAGARQACAAGAALGVTTMIRPDGIVLAAVSALLLAILLRDRTRLGWFGAAYALALAPMVLCLELFFGTLVPVSYYTKLDGLRNLGLGWAYLSEAVRSYHLVYALPLVIVPLWERRSRPLAIVLLALMGAWGAWVAVEGGDFMAYHRFLHPVWPLLALACGLGFATLAQRLESWRPALRPVIRPALAAVALGMALVWAAPAFRGSDWNKYEASAEDERVREIIGRWLAANFPRSEWLCVKPAGIIPYYSDMKTVDLFCLVDKKAAQTGQWVPGAWVGHQRMNAARIHEIGPRVVILEARLHPLDQLPSPGYTDPNHGGSWLEDPRASRYDAIRAEVLPGRWLVLFVRRYQAASLLHSAPVLAGSPAPAPPSRRIVPCALPCSPWSPPPWRSARSSPLAPVRRR